MTRRRLLQLSLLGGLGVLGLGGEALGLWSGGAYVAVPGLAVLSPKEAAVLGAAARRVVGVADVDVGAVIRFADSYLAQLDEALSSDVRALLLLLEHSPPLSGRRGRFTHLPPEAQDAVLRGWQGSALSLRRQGFQALKSLCCLGHYQDPRSFAAIGYDPSVGARGPGGFPAPGGSPGSGGAAPAGAGGAPG